MEDVASGNYRCRPHRIKSRSPKLNHAIAGLSEKLSRQFPGLPNLQWVALRLLEGDNSIIEAIRSGELGNIGTDPTPVQS